MGPMQPQGPPPAYAQMFNAQRGAQQPQGMPPMRPMMGPPPTGQPGPQQGMNPYAAMLQQGQQQQGRHQGQPGGGMVPPWMQHPQMPGQMGQPQVNPAVMQQRMQMAQQMAQQPRPQLQGQMGQPQPQGQPAWQMNPSAAR